MKPGILDRRIVGRDDELSRFGAWARDLQGGHGRVVLVEGEPGIGKSTLVRMCCDHAERAGCQVFWGAGDELGASLMLSPLLEGLQIRESTADDRRGAIAALLRGESAVTTGADLATAAAEQVQALVADLSRARPTILVIDDLQWADDATVAVWSSLARSAPRLPLLLIGTLRPVPRDDRMIAVRRAVRREHRLSLGPLAGPAVADLVASLTQGSPGAGLLALADGAGGNPLYLTEAMAALARSDSLEVTADGVVEAAGGQVPKSLSAAIADRLDFLPARVRLVLRTAALLGVDFSVSDLATVSGHAVGALMPALDEARAAGVLIEGEDGLAFRHALIRRALYDEIPEDVRAAWHQDAASALAGSGAPAHRVARQLGPALEWSRVTGRQVPDWIAPWLVDAVPRLVARAPRTALELLRLTVSQLPRQAPERGLLACRLAAALCWTGDAAAAERMATRELAVTTDPELVVDLLWTLSQCQITTGRSAESLPPLREALTRQTMAATHRARLLAILARTHHHLGEVDAAGRIAASALEEATRADDRWATGWSLHVLTVVSLIRGEVGPTLPLFDRALSVTHQVQELADLRLLLQINRAVALANLDRYEEAIAAARRVGAETRRTGSARQAQAHSVLGELLLDTGAWDDALLAVTAVPDGMKDPAGACCDLGVAAVIGFHRGQTAVARAHLAAAVEHAGRIGRRVVRSLALARSLEAERAGDPAAALAFLLAGLDSRAEELEEIEGLLPDAVRLALEVSDVATAAAIVARIESLAEGAPTPHRSAAVLYCRGLLRGDASPLLLAEAAYREVGLPLARAAALEAAASAQVQAGDRGSARASFTRAMDLYAELGARWDLGRLQARMRGHGIRRGSRTQHRDARHGWEGLTASEERVAALVTLGRSNSQIASDLFVSPRTVETHVSHILAKLGLRSRIDIAREASLRGTGSG